MFLRQDRFDFSDEGVPSAIIEVLDGDAETVLDLIAWPLHEPATFASTLGQAEEPGLWQFRKPASCGGSRLHVRRTPLS